MSLSSQNHSPSHRSAFRNNKWKHVSLVKKPQFRIDAIPLDEYRPGNFAIDEKNSMILMREREEHVKAEKKESTLLGDLAWKYRQFIEPILVFYKKQNGHWGFIHTIDTFLQELYAASEGEENISSLQHFREKTHEWKKTNTFHGEVIAVFSACTNQGVRAVHKKI